MEIARKFESIANGMAKFIPVDKWIWLQPDKIRHRLIRNANLARSIRPEQSFALLVDQLQVRVGLQEARVAVLGHQLLNFVLGQVEHVHPDRHLLECPFGCQPCLAVQIDLKQLGDHFMCPFSKMTDCKGSEPRPNRTKDHLSIISIDQTLPINDHHHLDHFRNPCNQILWILREYYRAFLHVVRVPISHHLAKKYKKAFIFAIIGPRVVAN